MKNKETLVLNFYKEDFKNSNYSANGDCPLARVVKRYLFPNPSVCGLGRIRETVDDYSSDQFLGSTEVRLNGKIIGKQFSIWEYDIIKDCIKRGKFKTATVKFYYL